MPISVPVSRLLRLILSFGLIAVSGAGVVRAATWVLANGDRLTGELVSEDAQAVEIQHPQLGRLRLAREQLRSEPEGDAAEADESMLADHLDPDPNPENETKAKDRSGLGQDNLRTGGGSLSWKRQIELGYSQQSGAKSKEDLTMRFQLDGRQGPNRYRATARLLQVRADEEDVTDRSEATFRWRRDVNKRLFTQSLTTYSDDAIRKIDLSLEQQVGGGLRLLDDRRHKANIGVGAVIQYLDRQDAEQQTAMLGSFFQDYNYQWNQRIKLSQESSFLISDRGSLNIRNGVADGPSDGSYRLKFNTALQSKVTNQMSLNVRLEYDYDRSVLEPDLRADQRLTTSLGYLW